MVSKSEHNQINGKIFRRIRNLLKNPNYKIATAKAKKRKKDLTMEEILNIEAVLEALSSQELQVIKLYYSSSEDALSEDDIAKKLNISVTEVQDSLKSGLLHIKEVLPSLKSRILQRSQDKFTK